MISEHYEIKYYPDKKYIIETEGLYQSEPIRSKRDNPYGKPIFDLENNCWISITENKTNFNLFLKHENNYYKSIINKLEIKDKEIITFNNFQEVKKIDNKWVNV